MKGHHRSLHTSAYQADNILCSFDCDNRCGAAHDHRRSPIREQTPFEGTSFINLAANEILLMITSMRIIHKIHNSLALTRHRAAIDCLNCAISHLSDRIINKMILEGLTDSTTHLHLTNVKPSVVCKKYCSVSSQITMLSY